MEDFTLIEDQTITLWIMSEKDFHGVFPLINSPEVLDTMVYNYPMDRDEFLDMCRKSPENAAQGVHYAYIISLKKSGIITGMCGLFDVHKERKKGELGYWIAPGFRRQGLAHAACSLVIQYAFSRQLLRKVWAETFATNVPSQQLLEKLGFRRIGVLEKEVFKHGKWVDRIQYELLCPH